MKLRKSSWVLQSCFLWHKHLDIVVSDHSDYLQNHQEKKQIMSSDGKNGTEPELEEAAIAPVSEELKSMVKSGEALPSNPKSLGYGIQQIKLETWQPENEEYWEVS